MTNRFEYNSQHVDDLLTNLFQNNEEFMVWKSIHLSTVKEILISICDYLHNNDKKSIILPIYNLFLGSYNHWVALIITKNNNFSTIYIESMDKSLGFLTYENSIFTNLIENNVDITQSYKKKHDDILDIGPWMVLNIHNLVIRRELHVNVDNETIIAQQNQLAHMLTHNEQISNNQTKIEITKSSMRIIYDNGGEKSRYRDVYILENILEELNKCQENQSYKKSFRYIGELCDQITPYDTKLKNVHDIINHYGYLYQNKKKPTTKQDGFPFNYLQALKEIIDNEPNVVSISSEDFNINQIANLRQHLLHILKSEIKYVSKQSTKCQIQSLSGNKPNIDEEFIKTCKAYYSKLLLHKMNNKLINFTEYDDNTKHYAVVGAMMQIGNLANKLSDCLNDNESIIIMLRRLYSIRNKIIHCHKQIKYKSAEIDSNILDLFRRIRRGINLNNSKLELTDIDEKIDDILEILKKNQIFHEETQEPNRKESKKVNMKVRDVNDLQCKIENKFEDINKEIENLYEIESERSDLREKKEIVLYGVYIVTQFVKDIQDRFIINSNLKDGLIDIRNKKSSANVLEESDSRPTKYLMDSSFDRKDHIKYLYINCEYRTNFVIPILLCNVGVSLFKLGLITDAINYLQKALEKITENEFVHTNEKFQFNRPYINPYRFHIEKTLGNILYWNNFKAEALKLFENNYSKKNMEGLNRIEWTNFMIDYAYLLTDNGDFGRAGKIFDIIKHLKCNISVKVKFMQAKCFNLNFEEAIN